MYANTRDGKVNLTASQVILNGIGQDNGLFIFEQAPKLALKKEMLDLSYQAVSKMVLRLFLDDFSDAEIDRAVENAYNKNNFCEKFVNIKTIDKFSFLELYHGPTLAFKDMALTILPYLFNIAKEKNSETDKTHILVATSGDTGGATLSSFYKVKGFQVTVIYPKGKVSQLQEQQMISLSKENVKAYAYEGNFDDCQNKVKEIFSSYKGQNGKLSSANSINFGRLLPQIIYYVYAYLQLVKDSVIEFGQKIDVSVPTGNFGDILAGYIAKQMGVPIDVLYCASNENNVLTDFFNKGVYDKNRHFYQTNSPAMDILVSSNLERLLYIIFYGDNKQVKKLMQDLEINGKYVLPDCVKSKLNDFVAGSCCQEETALTIRQVYKDYHYLIDPHTAVGYNVYKNNKVGNNHTLIISTASPYKFSKTVANALNVDCENEQDSVIALEKISGVPAPKQIRDLLNVNLSATLIDGNRLINLVNGKNDIIDVKVNATSANLACGFDCVGVCWQLYNKFRFESSQNDELLDFSPEHVKDNMVLNSYKFVFESLKLPYKQIKITQISNNIPNKHGLGSSASCIVAGILAGNYFSGSQLSKEQMIFLATKLEGHPDNVSPCLLGGYTTAFTLSDKVVTNQYNVSEKIKFTLLIPDFNLSTSLAREVLPQKIDMDMAVFNISRAINLNKALENGDIELLKLVLVDKLHQPYRMKLIPNSEEIFDIAKSHGYASCISGAGPTLLLAGEDYFPLSLLGDYAKSWQVMPISIDNTGAKITEVTNE